MKTLNIMTLSFENQLMSLQDRMLYFALRLTRNMEDARDLTQESLLKALANRDQYKADTNFKAWLYTIVRNTFINGTRRDRRGQRVMESAALLELAMVNGQHVQGPLATYSTQEIEQRVERLPVQVRMPFTMNFEGYKYQEIAEEMGIPIGTVKSRIFQARRMLMNELGEHAEAA
ncbi:MAG: sigma-70 family RNA polymerase sigma factor [Flavobacteriales bacterium]|jgi:RNA polymerase sigma factor (sigma-70 family)|nr:sigma-70 family RNA polymerase sigma factor [Flavobacteriales bacterium]MBK6881548.1 sigma-70 family RNA polymerase sigma factor [Flavobacteriales bacterium]MBK7102865.1 sigma-70 family RNA polymerase sigma factor [Flavobacteriales bacterium]MBK7113530.1 sigma-70 family RNA polymerase sigma factor [Flavobacteriales bacterium]MBK7482485.1 sigma-70 family RNA polymerase sigma factor [Flavobacteriales bacterium]